MLVRSQSFTVHVPAGVTHAAACKKGHRAYEDLEVRAWRSSLALKVAAHRQWLVSGCVYVARARHPELHFFSRSKGLYIKKF